MQNYNLGKIRGKDVTWGDTSLMDLEEAPGVKRRKPRDGAPRDVQVSGLVCGA